MSLPGKGLEGHLCPTIVTLWWRHCEMIYSFMNLLVQNKLLHCDQGTCALEVWRIMRRIGYHDK